ncbi:MAG: gliding motility-associated C-terminal domain-containing protein [Crocinitomicaceae bacterium]|nr:gliding motility-associated C-terminal domain-containing protein [Crocinitomicaceae bacterium]
MNLFRILLFSLLSLISVQLTFAQCANPTTMLFEDFDGPSPIVGAITANIYGGGSHNNAAYVLSGTKHGWFNVVNGLGDVDVYDRNVQGFCVDSIVNVSFWTRHSFGSTNVTFSVEDDFGAVMVSQTLDLTNTYQQINFNFPAVTPGLNFIIHCNSTGGNGVDIIVEDLLITQCVTSVFEDIVYGVCNQNATVDLFTLFNEPITNGGMWNGPSVLGNGDQGTFDAAVNLNGVYTYTPIGNCATPSTVTVNVMPIVDVGPDSLICDGDIITLDAGTGFDSYLWSTGETTQTINISNAATYSVDVSLVLGNLISNGDFEAGDTGFSTGYVPGSGGGWGLISNPGEYAITTSPSLAHNNFTPCGDHTTGTGNMLVVNGSSIPNTSVWCQTVAVTPGTDYDFSCWVSNALTDPNVGELQFYVNGAAIGSVFTTSTVGCQWVQYTDSWNSGVLTSADLCIVNQSIAGSGNDFCVDDIEFGPTCVASDTMNLAVETNTQVVNSLNPSCLGILDGSIIIDNPNAVEYSVDGGLVWQTDSFFLNLPAGSYDVCSRSVTGCDICEGINLVDPDPVTIVVSNDTLICQNGTANLSAFGAGGVSFDYIWGHTGDLSANQFESPAVATIYTVIAENENGCQSAPEEISVTVNPPLSGFISENDTICPGFDSNIQVTVNGGMGEPYNFIWSDGTVQNGSSNQILNTSPTISTGYTVTVTDGCESSPLLLNASIVVSQLPEPSYQVLNPNQCEPAIFEIVNTTDDLLSQFNYWLINGEDQYLNQDTITTNSLMSGQYDLQLIITSFEGCVDSITVIDALDVKPKPSASFTHSPNPVTMFNTTVLFQNTSFYGSNYQWMFENGEPSSSTAEDATVSFPDGVTGTYDVQLVVSSELGCTDTVDYDLIVLPEVLVYAPNSFTPDGDEFNQTWRVFMEGVDVYDFELLLYNRWGELIWKSYDMNLGWDGTYNARPVEVGLYTWVINTKDRLNDNKYTYNGFVNLMR